MQPAVSLTAAPGDTPDSHGGTTPAESNADIPGLLSHIRQLMRAQGRYPMQARRRGWEGEVLLGFRINSAGLINDVRIAQGSGYAVLDSTAAGALRRVGLVPRASEWLPAGEVHLELSVVYKLTDS